MEEITENKIINLDEEEKENISLDSKKELIQRFHRESVAIPQDRDYRQEMFDRYDTCEIREKHDDSFLYDEDKLNLVKYVKEYAQQHYSSYPSPMYEILIERLYDDMVKNTDKEEYFREKEELKNKSILEIELSKINKLSGL